MLQPTCTRVALLLTIGATSMFSHCLCVFAFLLLWEEPLHSWLLVGLISRGTEVAIAPEKLRVQLSSNDCFCRVNSNSSGERPVSQKQWVSPAAVFPRKKSLVDAEIRCQVWERRSPCRIIVSKVVWYRYVGRRHSRFNDADKAVLPTMGQLTTTLQQSLDALQRLIARCSDSKQSPELSFIPWITS